jgi:peptidyl-prolyl cis-trans isomerase A (cyclophilin A)
MLEVGRQWTPIDGILSTIEDEFPDGGHRFNRPGMVGMANTGRNSNGSQFFITTADVDDLSGKHTCWGEVVD